MIPIPRLSSRQSPAEAEVWVAFRNTFKALYNRIRIFTSLPLVSLDRIKSQKSLDAIGKTALGRGGRPHQ